MHMCTLTNRDVNEVDNTYVCSAVYVGIVVVVCIP